ncbi:MAG: hypothetical protein CM15mP46_4160 [Alphaproteobacteria bacterium]|nr:MAG: hypothetical protein CM15mP46_4160 [Alphaproteobacteria bacterium]
MRHIITRFIPAGNGGKRVMVPFLCGMRFGWRFAVPPASLEKNKNGKIFRQLGPFWRFFPGCRGVMLMGFNEKNPR